MNLLQKIQAGVVRQVTINMLSGVKARVDLMKRYASGNVICAK